jgi:hypothetical protein
MQTGRNSPMFQRNILPLFSGSKSKPSKKSSKSSQVASRALLLWDYTVLHLRCYGSASMGLHTLTSYMLGLCFYGTTVLDVRVLPKLSSYYLVLL